MKLVIAEKPELARDIANAILKGNIRNLKYALADDTYIVTNVFGHLLKLADPALYDEKYTHWDIEDLPIYFENWKHVPDKEEYKLKRLKVIEKLLGECDCVIHAGDPDDEGQLLIDEILDYFNFNKPVYRVYVNDNIAKNILKEFDNLKINDDRERANGKAAYARQMADICFGVNETRLAGITLRKKGLSIGRVQTPTLGLIVNRDYAIKNHIKTKYYELMAKVQVNDEELTFSFKPNKELLGEEKYILDRTVLENISSQITSKNFTCRTQVSNKEQAPPLPFNATELASEISRKFGYSLKEIDNSTQSLREKHKAITYNRSDCQYLKEEHFQNAPTLLPIVFKNLGITFIDYPCDYSLHSKCFNDKNVSAHHAIIPQEKQVDLSAMSEQERNVYVVICERYIMQFLPNVKYTESIATIELAKGILQYKAKHITDMGFRRYFWTEISDEENLLAEGESNVYIADCNIAEKETKPLKPYTPGTLVKDMASIAKYVTDPEIAKILKEKDKGKKGEHGGIGTVATRTATIDTLFKRGFISYKGKAIVSTKLGREFYSLLPQNIKTANITAKWWLIQEEIRKGTLDVNELQKSVVEEFCKHKNTAYKNASLSSSENSLKCPICNKSLIKHSWGYGCSAYKDGCKFAVNGTICGKKITDNQMQLLLQNGSTNIIKGFKSKRGATFDAKLKLSNDGKIELVFPKKK